jgi:hypothetical protein
MAAWMALLATAALLISSMAFGDRVVFGQAYDVEPNNSCVEANDLGAVTLPFNLSGSLDGRDSQAYYPPLGSENIDYFAAQLTPESYVEVTLSGAFAFNGVAYDAALGTFDSNCWGLNTAVGSAGEPATLIMRVPSDGALRIAVTTTNDFGFVDLVNGGYGAGSYELALREVDPVEISGTVVDATTGEPIAYAYVDLLRCEAVDACFEYLGYRGTDEAGRFSFFSTFFDTPLTDGLYSLSVYSYAGYVSTTVGPFEVSGADVDVGEIALERLPKIGSISGQVVDGITGTPLSGQEPPFAYVYLERLFSDFSAPFWGGVDSTTPDSEGRFFFPSFALLEPGTYRIVAYASDYEPTISDAFDVAENEDYDVGQIELSGYPLRFGAVTACAVPSAGGRCTFSVEVIAGGKGPDTFQVWPIVNAYGSGSRLNRTTFQPSLPRTLRLKPGQQRTLSYSFHVPGSAADGTYICAEAFASRDVQSRLFDTLANTYLFCIYKGDGGFSTIQGAELQEFMRERNGTTGREGVPGR